MTKGEKLAAMAREIKDKAETLDALASRRGQPGIEDTDLQHLAARLRNEAAVFLTVATMGEDFCHVG